MSKIIIQRELTSDDAHQGLRAALEAALPGKLDGLSSGPGAIVVYLKNTATAEDENTARQVVLNHDMNIRTPAQIEAAAIATAGTNIIARYAQTELAGKTPDEIYTLMQTAVDNITSLAEAKTFLRKWLPLMASVDQLEIRRLNAQKGT